MSLEHIDPDSGLPVLVKQPSESRLFTLDFAPLLDGTTVASITSITVDRQDEVANSDVIAATEQNFTASGVRFRLAGGTHNENYKVTALVVDSGANTLEAEGMLYVREL